MPDCPAAGGYEERECGACEGSGELNPGDLVLLPGGLLGRVVRLAEGGMVVDRYHVGAASEGWRRMSGIEGRPLPAGDVREHGYYARAMRRWDEVAT